MKSVSVCVATLAALQVVLSAPQEFSQLFDTPANLRDFHPSNTNYQTQQKPSWLNSRSSSSWNDNTHTDARANTGSNFRNRNYQWASGRQQLASRNDAPRMMQQQQQRTMMMMNNNNNMRMMNDAPSTNFQARQASIPVISVPPLLPPIPSVTEQDLYGSVNIDALTAPYSLGDNTTDNQTPVQLPDTFQVVNGSYNLFYHGFANSNKVQDVVSNHLINTFTNQTNHVQVNNLDLHRFYKLVNATTNYITNVQRVNQSSIFHAITNNNATEYQPFLYITQSQTNTVNDNGQAVQLPVIESSSVSSVALPPVFDTPQVTKFDYSGNPVSIPAGNTGRK